MFGPRCVQHHNTPTAGSPTSGHKAIWPRSLGAARWALVAMVFASSAAMAQTTAQCTNMDKLGETQLRVTQQSGRALVELTRPNSTGRKIEIEYGDESYVGRFERDGRARLGFALTDAKNEISIRMSETPAITCKIDVPDFAKIYRVILRWRDPIQLDLHVIEPGRRMGEFGHVSPGRPWPS